MHYVSETVNIALDQNEEGTEICCAVPKILLWSASQKCNYIIKTGLWILDVEIRIPFNCRLIDSSGFLNVDEPSVYKQIHLFRI